MERKLTAILSADVKGYSRLMGEDEEATIRTLTAYREVMGLLIQQHRGRVIDSPGDNLLAEFASAVDAVQSAVAIQKELQTRNAELPDHRQMQYRIGINVGDVIVEGDRLYGDGVNIAARLEGLAEPGGICLSGTAYDQVENKLALGYEFLGEQVVKNIAKSVRVYRVREGETIATAQVSRKEAGARLPLPDKPSILVLPFINMSNDPEQEYFSDGITEDITTDLSKISSLFVISRNSAFTYKGRAAKAQDISREMGVQYVLEGSVRKASERIRVTAQLIDATTDHHLWAERYDRSLTDIFALQDEIVQQIVTTFVEKLKIKLLEKEKTALLNRYQDNLEAYNLYLKGRYYWAQRPQGIKKAVEYFEQAIEKDPNYALAHAGLADCYVTLGSWENGTLPPSDAMLKGKSAARKALELDNTLAEAHSSLAYGTTHYDWDWRVAETQFNRAFDLNPNYAIGHHWYSHYLTAMGRPEESLIESKKCLELDPLDLVINIHLAWHYQFARQYDEAIEQCWKTSELYPNSFWPSYFFALAYEQQGKFEEAAAEFEKAVKMSGGVTFATAGLGHLYAAAGKKAEAQTIINDLQELAKKKYVPAYDIAVIYVGLGQRDQVFEWLDRAYQERLGWLAYLKVEPRLDDLRSDSRFTDLLRRVGLTS